MSTLLRDGQNDLADAIANLRDRLPVELAPLARIAFNYRWSWMPGGTELFQRIDASLWREVRQNPRTLLEALTPRQLQALAQDPQFIDHLSSIVRACDADLQRPVWPGAEAHQPIAYFCAEFGFHASLPIYSGGLGILAGDILKVASDLALPMIGVGLFYRQGYFHQRLDVWGWQHEYWVDLPFDRMPAARVTDATGQPLAIEVPIRGRSIVTHVWRVQVGRTTLYLLDVDHELNDVNDRWITARLYVGDRTIRLAQYALLGIGGIRILSAMGITPSVIHLNEGHAALSSFERLRQKISAGQEFDAALAAVRNESVFTTHTPVAAGNEGYHEQDIEAVLGDFLDSLGVSHQTFYDLGRVTPGSPSEPVNITPLALRTSKAAIGVSRRHGEVARHMWQPLWPDRPVAEVPIGHITNGVHVASWMLPPMQALLRKHLGPAWPYQVMEPDFAERVKNIPDEEIWQVRCTQRHQLVEMTRSKSIRDRLSRGEEAEYVQAASRTFHPDTLTVGFARRVATYKRLYLLSRLPEGGLLRLLSDSPRPLQLILAGKAHPADHEAKEELRNRFQLKHAREIGQRVAFLVDYDLRIAPAIVGGVDLWLNLPRPPLEASGTSGMKVVLNGGLNLSVLDGWWDEAYDGENGWAIRSPDADPQTQDEHDARLLFELLETQVLPMFYERDAGGIPRAWVQRMKHSMATLMPRFSAERMMRDYIQQLYG